MKSLWQIFQIPLILAGLSLLGLIAALVGDGLADAISWGSLGAIVVTTVLKACHISPPLRTPYRSRHPD